MKHFITLLCLVLSSVLSAQPKLNVVYSTEDAVKVGDEFTAYIFLENVTEEYAFASLTMWFYYDAAIMKLMEHSFDKSIIPDLGSPFFSESYNKKIKKEADFETAAKVNVGFYRASKVVKNGLLLSLKMKAIKAGKPEFRFTYAEIGSFEFKTVDGSIVSNPLEILGNNIEQLRIKKQ